MLHIFLVILKIIGIILAALLGIVFVLVLCVLFWPVRYRVEGRHFDKWEGKARINYLGPVIWFNISYTDELFYRLRICGITVMSSDKETSPKKSKGMGNSVNNKKTSILDEEEEPDESVEQISQDTINPSVSKVEEHSELVVSKQENNSVQHETSAERTDDTSSKEDKPGIFERIANLKQTITDKIKSIWESIKDIFRLLCNIKETYDDERVKTGLRKLKSEIWLLLKKIRPRRLKWYVKFGFDDPASTGQILAVLGVLQGLWGKEMHVEPDFEKKILETEFKFKGFIQSFRLVRLGWKCYFDKDIQYLIEKSNSLRRS